MEIGVSRVVVIRQHERPRQIVAVGVDYLEGVEIILGIESLRIRGHPYLSAGHDVRHRVFTLYIT